MWNQTYGNEEYFAFSHIGRATGSSAYLYAKSFHGYFDEFKIYDRPISLLEANNRYLFPGEIINRDTTIFVGNSVNLSAGNNCANSLVWSPVNGLSVTNDFNTIATPTESTSYTLSTVAIDGCTQTDTVRINVISDDDISCENLLLPNQHLLLMEME